jgi:hypothetical protein
MNNENVIYFIGRNSDGRESEYTTSLEEAEAFASSGESLEWGEIGVFGWNPENPCCEGPCTHEVIRAEIVARVCAGDRRRTYFVGRNSDGQCEAFASLEEAEAFAESGESLDISSVGVYGFTPASPCCPEGPCTHEFFRARLRAAGIVCPA